jgi:hypothetical protein
MSKDAKGLEKKSTITQFKELRKNQQKARISSLYSYNVFDNPAYLRSKRVEQKLMRLKQKLEDKRKKQLDNDEDVTKVA